MQKNTAQSVKQAFAYHDDMAFAELRYSHESQCAYKAHSHETFSIGAIIAGATLLTLEATKETLPLHPGQLIVIQPDCVHSCNPINNQPRSYFMLYLKYDWLLNQAQLILGKDIQTIHFNRRAINHPELFEQYLLFTKQFQQKNLVSAQNILLMLIKTLIETYAEYRHSVLAEPALIQTIKRTYTHELEAPPSISNLAKTHLIRPETLIRSFKKCTGISPKAFLNNSRIEKAKQLLKSGFSICEVAYMLGFADQSHFQKTFTHYTASTPRQYQCKTSIFDKI